MAKMDEKEWTLMFYFASDHSLAPDIVSQLKSIKQAGFHPEANVIVQFDPNPEHAGTHIFDINRINKLQANGDKKSKIGFIGFKPNDPFVVNLMTDKLWRDDAKEGPIRQLIIDLLKNKRVRETLRNKTYFTGTRETGVEKELEFDPPIPPPFTREPKTPATFRRTPQTSGGEKPSNEPSPMESLGSFLTFCSENYPARHYILFILGHGVVVGNDTFLFDENALEHSLNLQSLRIVLEKFKENARAKLELISFHSCSMSSLEIACELQDVANYMLASQSPSFVGSWPYRQILIRIFNYLKRKEGNIKNLLTKIFHYCWFNGHDFLVAGYPSDLCLCDLNRVPDIEGPISYLSAKLIEGLSLEDKRARESVGECILLAHLSAQSYFNENYTDVYDFCFRLQQEIEKSAIQQLSPATAEEIKEACQKVQNVLEAPKRGVRGKNKRLIIRSGFIGAAYQYSHGMSVYFPWAKPVNSKFWPEEYNQYRFINKDSANDKGEKAATWSDFLKTYFEETRRRTRATELTETEIPGFRDEEKDPSLEELLLEAFTIGTLNSNGQLGLDKPDPASSQGASCSCQSIKNYPPFTREPKSGGVPGGKIVEESTWSMEAEGSTFAIDGLND